MAQLETVKIVSPKSDSGYVIINLEDFDAEAHTRFVEGSPARRNLGEVQDPGGEAEPEDLMRLTKAQLVAKAEEIGITVVPDEMTKQQIVDAITAANDDE